MSCCAAASGQSHGRPDALVCRCLDRFRCRAIRPRRAFRVQDGWRCFARLPARQTLGKGLRGAARGRLACALTASIQAGGRARPVAMAPVSQPIRNASMRAELGQRRRPCRRGSHHEVQRCRGRLTRCEPSGRSDRCLSRVRGRGKSSERAIHQDLTSTGLFDDDRAGVARLGCHLAYSSAAIAKFKFCASFRIQVVIPRRWPWPSNKPPPDEPFEIGAEV